MKIKELAKLVSGTILGNAETKIEGVASIEAARPGDLVFVLNEKFLATAIASRAAGIVARSKSDLAGKTGILVDNPHLAMAKILPLFAPKPPKPKGIHQTAVIPKSCKISRGAAIGPFVVLEEEVVIGAGTVIYPHTFIGRKSIIGKDCVIHSNVSIYPATQIGSRVIINSGVRVGVDGYGFAQEAGRHIKIPQISYVKIEDDVELFANVCVARGTLSPTVIGAGTKIDNLTHIAHNTILGKDCAITALVGFAGSVTFKDRVFVGGQAGFNGHITVGENTVVMAKAGVTKDVPANSVISGFPAQNHRQEMAYQAALKKLAKNSSKK